MHRQLSNPPNTRSDHNSEYANEHFIDYACALKDPLYWNALLEHVGIQGKIQKALGRYDLFWYKHLRAQDQDVSKLFEGAELMGSSFSAHVTKLDSDYSAWRSNSMSKSRTKNHDRRRRGLARHAEELEIGECRFDIATDADDIEACFHQLQDWRKDRYKDHIDPDLLQEPERFDFYLDVAKYGAKNGTAVTSKYCAGDKLIAVSFGLLKDRVYYHLLPGADIETFGKFSPGMLMLEDLIEHLIQEGCEYCDFTVGDEAYKQTFGSEPVDILAMIHAPTLIGKGGKKLLKILRDRRNRQRAEA